MRIFYSSDSDPMILDSVINLTAIHATLMAFLGEETASFRLNAITIGSPEPYSEFLPYLEFIKSQGKVLVQMGEDRGLLISGSANNLAAYIEAFEFKENEDGNHHHPEFSLINENNFKLNSLWPFVAADNDYVNDNRETAC
jgi:hypothetical protein